MKRKFLGLLVAALAAGTAFAWYTIIGDYRRFLGAGATFLQFEGCRYPNPLATPCFYGGVVFALALAWSLRLRHLGTSAPRHSLRNLTLLLTAGTLFAWGNFGWELWKYYRPHEGPILSCSGTVMSHPVNTPCFYGALLYAFALLVAWNALRAPADPPEPSPPGSPAA